MNTGNNINTSNPKEEGKVQPIKLNKEELEKRKETGYSTDEASKKNPREKNADLGKQDDAGQ